MHFELNEEQKMIRDMVRDFAEKEVAPKAQETDREHKFPMDTFKKMAGLGFFGMPFPEEYGGMGADATSFAIAVEEISRACGSTGITYVAQTSLAATPIYWYGTEEQKQKYLVPLATGEKIGAYGLTEPGAGSDAGGTKTTAVLDGDEWVINGTKTFITNGSLADILVFTAKTDPTQGTHGISSFIVEKGTPGFTPGRNEDKMGLRGSVTSQIFFEDCRIPKENILGAENEGFKQFLRVLDSGRISIGAMALGLAQAALDKAIPYAQERQQFGRPIAAFQAIQWMLADMATEIDAARLMVYRAAWLKEQGVRYTKEAAMAKLYASEVAERVCFKAIQIHGGYGYTAEYDVERIYRDQRLCTIGEGTSEIQRMVIARHLVGRL